MSVTQHRYNMQIMAIVLYIFISSGVYPLISNAETTKQTTDAIPDINDTYTQVVIPIAKHVTVDWNTSHVDVVRRVVKDINVSDAEISLREEIAAVSKSSIESKDTSTSEIGRAVITGSGNYTETRKTMKGAGDTDTLDFASTDAIGTPAKESVSEAKSNTLTDETDKVDRNATHGYVTPAMDSYVTQAMENITEDTEDNDATNNDVSLTTNEIFTEDINAIDESVTKLEETFTLDNITTTDDVLFTTEKPMAVHINTGGWTVKPLEEPITLDSNADDVLLTSEEPMTEEINAADGSGALFNESITVTMDNKSTDGEVVLTSENDTVNTTDINAGIRHSDEAEDRYTTEWNTAGVTLKTTYSRDVTENFSDSDIERFDLPIQRTNSSEKQDWLTMKVLILAGSGIPSVALIITTCIILVWKSMNTQNKADIGGKRDTNGKHEMHGTLDKEEFMASPTKKSDPNLISIDKVYTCVAHAELKTFTLPRDSQGMLSENEAVNVDATPEEIWSNGNVNQISQEQVHVHDDEARNENIGDKLDFARVEMPDDSFDLPPPPPELAMDNLCGRMVIEADIMNNFSQSHEKINTERPGNMSDFTSQGIPDTFFEVPSPIPEITMDDVFLGSVFGNGNREHFVHDSGVIDGRADHKGVRVLPVQTDKGQPPSMFIDIGP